MEKDARRGGYDLATGCFLHTRLPDTRAELLGHLGGLVAPGGWLLLISHASVPPWAPDHDGHGHGHDLPRPSDDAVLLRESGTGDWEIKLAEVRTRAVISPDGTYADLDDGIVLARKALSPARDAGRPDKRHIT